MLLPLLTTDWARVKVGRRLALTNVDDVDRVFAVSTEWLARCTAKLPARARGRWSSSAGGVAVGAVALAELGRPPRRDLWLVAKLPDRCRPLPLPSPSLSMRSRARGPLSSATNKLAAGSTAGARLGVGTRLRAAAKSAVMAMWRGRAYAPASLVSSGPATSRDAV